MLAARLERRLDTHHAANLAMGTGRRAERHGLHPRDRLQPMREPVHEFERALDGDRGLQGMDVGKARQPRDLLVDTRIVLHRARAERIDAGVDRIILLRQARVVADHLRLAQARQADLPLSPQPAEAIGHFWRGRQIDPAPARSVLLEKQRLLEIEAATLARRRRAEARHRLAPIAHRKASRSAIASAVISVSVLSSVAATRRRSAWSGPGASRLTGTPASTPCSASASTTGAAGRLRRSANSLKKFLLTSVTPGTSANISASFTACA